jgi:dethiobiotin synthetase
MKTLCIVGTDTGIGKTFVTAGIANYFQEQKLDFQVQKWVSTGDKKGLAEDLKLVLNSLELKKTENLFQIKKKFKRKDYLFNNPYSFKFPASPHLSAGLEKKRIDPEKIRNSVRHFKNKTDHLLIEGVGGLMVPLTKKLLLIELIKELKIPVVLVSPNVLGTINSTLSSLNILEQKKIRVLGIIYNESFKEHNDIRKDNIKIIKHFSGVPYLGSFGKISTRGQLLKQFIPIGKKLGIVPH